jgi:predicted glycosyltransferase
LFCRFCNRPDFASNSSSSDFSLFVSSSVAKDLINNNNTMKYNNNRETILATKIVKPEKKTNKKFQAFGLKQSLFWEFFNAAKVVIILRRI